VSSCLVVCPCLLKAKTESFGGDIGRVLAFTFPFAFPSQKKVSRQQSAPWSHTIPDTKRAAREPRVGAAATAAAARGAVVAGEPLRSAAWTRAHRSCSARHLSQRSDNVGCARHVFLRVSPSRGAAAGRGEELPTTSVERSDSLGAFTRTRAVAVYPSTSRGLFSRARRQARGACTLAEMRRFGGSNCHLRDCRHGGRPSFKSV